MKEYIVHAPKTNVMAVEEYTSFYGEPVEELVRCKDCKYYRVYKHPDWTVELCGRFRTTMADPVKEDDYCSKAERKEE